MSESHPCMPERRIHWVAMAEAAEQLRVTEVSIAVRLRPPLPHEAGEKAAVQLKEDDASVSVRMPGTGRQRKVKRFMLDVALPAE